MLGSQRIMAFVATRQPEAAKVFYGQTLGLKMLSEDPFALVFDAGGTMLRVQKVAELSPARHTALGWQVEDIARTAQQLQAAGVSLARFPGMEQDELGVWTAPGGARVAWFQDPDGNTLSLTQF